MAASDTPHRRQRHEVTMFLILAVVIWPFVAVAVVGGYGFLVWMYFALTGPPGPV
jgi:nitrate reductase NapE